MPARTAQASKLLLDSEQMLEGAKRNDDERKGLAQIEFRHVAVHQTDALADGRRLTLQLLPAAGQHEFRKVKTDSAEAALGQRKQNPPGAAAQLEDRLALRPRHGEIELGVLPAGDRREIIVVFGDKRLIGVRVSR